MGKTKEQIGFNMKQVKNKDSEIELLLRRALWIRGIRYRKNVNSILGHPDIAWKTKKVAVFIDGEFWHGFDWENRKKDFKSNQEFWIPKIERNMQRDLEVTERLQNEGWKVLRFWGKDVKKHLEECVQTIMEAIGKNGKDKVD